MPEASRRTIQLSPDAEALPEGLLLPPEEGGEVVGCLVDGDVRDWAGPALMRLARGWAERGRAVVLVDADFASPFMAGAAGVDPGEGLSDALHFGASPERILSEVPGATWHLVTPGTVVPDPLQSWSHGGWAHLVDALKGEARVLLLVLPADREAARSLTSHADRVFHLSGTRPGPDAPHPVIHPPEALEARPDPLAVAGGPPLGEAAGGEGRGAPPQGITRADQDTLAERKPAAPAAGTAATSSATLPTTSRRGGSGRRLFLLVLVVVLALLLLGALWLGVLELPGG
jgi:hypothetical protein